MKPKLLFLWYFHHFNEHAVYMPVIIITNKALMPFNGILRACIIVIAKNADIWPSGSPFPTLFKVSPIICLIFLSWRCTSDRICVLQSLLIPFVNAGTFFWQLHHKTRYSQQAGIHGRGEELVRVASSDFCTARTYLLLSPSLSSRAGAGSGAEAFFSWIFQSSLPESLIVYLTEFCDG